MTVPSSAFSYRYSAPSAVEGPFGTVVNPEPGHRTRVIKPTVAAKARHRFATVLPSTLGPH